MNQTNQVLWNVWLEKEQPAINGKNRRWKLDCSLCGDSLVVAIVFPENALRICPKCVLNLNDVLQNEMEE